MNKDELLEKINVLHGCLDEAESNLNDCNLSASRRAEYLEGDAVELARQAGILAPEIRKFASNLRP